MRKHLLGAACVAAFSIFGLTAAMADPAPATTSYATVPQAVIGGDYTYLQANHGSSANEYGGEAGGIVPFGDNFSGQIFGGYHGVTANHGGGTVDNFDVGGDLAWSSDMGRIGANVAYSNDSGGGAHGDVTNYGVFGEYYASDQFTIGLRGGGATLSDGASFSGFHVGGSETGGYAGAELVGYVTPDFDVQAHVQYAGVNDGNQTGVGVQAEYLLSESTPISGSIGYDYGRISGGGFSENTNAFTVGLHYYFGGSGTLVQRHRSGVDGWGPDPVNVVF